MSSHFSVRQLLTAAAFAIPAISWAAYPDHAIEWVVPYAAGGGSDVVARVVAETMGKKLGQPMVVMNKPGAATNIGADYAARAKPDGYTILTGDTGTLAANPYLYKKTHLQRRDRLCACGHAGAFSDGVGRQPQLAGEEPGRIYCMG